MPRTSARHSIPTACPRTRGLRSVRRGAVLTTRDGLRKIRGRLINRVLLINLAHLALLIINRARLALLINRARLARLARLARVINRDRLVLLINQARLARGRLINQARLAQARLVRLARVPLINQARVEVRNRPTRTMRSVSTAVYLTRSLISGKKRAP